MLDNKHFSLFRLFLYIIIYFILISLPLKVIESRSLCLFFNLFSLNCLGCGLTRAFFNMFHLNIFKAITYNPLILIFFPLILIISLNDFYVILKRLILKDDFKTKSIFEKVLNFIYK